MAFDLRPMLASLTDAPLADPQLVYEPKYDGIRAIVEIAPRGQVRLWSSLGNEKTRQFPEITRAFEDWARRRTARSSWTARSSPSTRTASRPAFSSCRDASTSAAGRMTNHNPGRPTTSALLPTGSLGSRFLAFDLLRDGDTDYRDRPLTERRAALERLFARTEVAACFASATGSRRRPRAVRARALAAGWEGLIAKHAASMYQSGKRTPDWRKLKIVHEQEFVDRRVDRAASVAGTSARCCSASTKKMRLAALKGPRTSGFSEPEAADLRRPHRHRVQRTRAGACQGTARAARNRSRRRLRETQRRTSGRIG